MDSMNFEILGDEVERAEDEVTTGNRLPAPEVALKRARGGLGECDTHTSVATTQECANGAETGQNGFVTLAMCAGLENSPSGDGGEADLDLPPEEMVPPTRKRSRKSAGVDHSSSDTRRPPVDSTHFDDRGHQTLATQAGSAPVVDPLIESIVGDWRRRQAWHKAEKSLTLQCLALCRGLTDGDKDAANKLFKEVEAFVDDGKPMSGNATLAFYLVEPLIRARTTVCTFRTGVEKELAKSAKGLAVASWVKSVKGFGIGSLAAIVGEAGDLSKYANPAKLWKRLGLAPHDGKSYSTWRRTGGLSADDWTEAGYSPRRRSTMWNAGAGVIGGMGKGSRPLVGEDFDAREDKTEYEKLFVARLRHEAVRDPETFGRPPVEKEGMLKESFSAHAAARAKRYVEKRLVLHLWRAWRDAA